MERSAHEIVQLARDQKRLTSLDFIEQIFDNFQEFHGDRYFADDQAVVGGVA
ncbi:acetyl-CoA carboxylase carboxyl transferase subunit alpha, partial [Tetragenococcus halophilus]